MLYIVLHIIYIYIYIYAILQAMQGSKVDIKAAMALAGGALLGGAWKAGFFFEAVGGLVVVLLGGLLCGLMEALKGQAAMKTEFMEALKDLLKGQDEALKDLFKGQVAMKEALLEALWKVEDRCDKAGNKLEVIERRLEAFTFNTDDAKRHIMQVIQEFRKSIGGPEVASRWLKQICEKWRVARSRLSEGGGVKEWRMLVKAVYIELKAMIKMIQGNGDVEDMKEAEVWDFNMCFLQEHCPLLQEMSEDAFQAMQADQAEELEAWIRAETS